jgi:hypothetical protein
MTEPLWDIRLVVPDRVVARAVDGLMVLLDVETGRTFALDSIGTQAWQALTAAPTVQHGVDALAAEYDGDTATIARDVTALIRTLAERQLVLVTPR